MNMIDLLTSMAVAVDDQTIAVFGDAFLFGDLRRGGDHAAQRGFVLHGHIVDGWDQHVGNDQHMGGCLRGDVTESGDQFILINHISRDFASDNNLATLPAAGESCPMVDFVNLVSGKWAIPILYRLIMIDGPVRFSELQRAVAPIAQKELTRQLRLFEQRGLVTRQVYPEVPPRVEYQVTALGKSLRPTLDSLAEWMRRHAPLLIGG